MHTIMKLYLFLVLLFSSENVVAGMIPEAVASLLLESSCTVVALGLDKSTIQNMVSSMEYAHETEKSPLIPPVVTTDGNGINLEPLKKISQCFIGLAKTENHVQLQMALYPAHGRQLILVPDTLNERSKNISIVPLINPNHHPAILLKRSESNDHEILKKVACHDGRVLVTNVYRRINSDWTIRNDMVGSYPTERICNNGNLPLHGQTVKASVFSTIPWVYRDENRKLAGGVVVDMFKIIAEYLKFDYEIDLRSNWYQFFPNGTIGESLGDVLYGKADVSLEQYKQVASMFGDMSTNTYFDHGVFMELKPKEFPKYTNIVHPLDVWTWMWLAIVFGVITLAFYFTHSFEDKSKHLTFTLTLQMTFGIIFHECSLGRIQDKTSRFLQLRMLWVVLTMLLTMIYAGNLESSLVKRNYEKRTMTKVEMLDKDMTIHTSSTLVDFYRSPQAKLDPFNARLLCQAEKKNSIYVIGNNYNDQTSKLLLEHGGATGNSVYSVEDLRSKYLKKGIDFPFVNIPEKTGMLQFGMFFQKYNPKASYFNDLIELMRDAGVTDYLLRRALPYQDIKKHIHLKEEKLVMEHFYLPQIFLLVGLVGGMLTFGFEFFKKQRKSVL